MTCMAQKWLMWVKLNHQPTHLGMVYTLQSSNMACWKIHHWWMIFPARNLHLDRIFQPAMFDYQRDPEGIYIYICLLVGGLEHLLFFHKLGITVPTDYMFQRGSNHQPVFISPTKFMKHLQFASHRPRIWQVFLCLGTRRWETWITEEGQTVMKTSLYICYLLFYRLYIYIYIHILYIYTHTN